MNYWYHSQGAINFCNKFVSDTKVEILSDNLYLPRLTKNGVPIFDSFRSAKLVNLIRNMEAVYPLYFLATVHYPAVMILSGIIYYIGFYKVNAFS